MMNQTIYISIFVLTVLATLQGNQRTRASLIFYKPYHLKL